MKPKFLGALILKSIAMKELNIKYKYKKIKELIFYF